MRWKSARRRSAARPDPEESAPSPARLSSCPYRDRGPRPSDRRFGIRRRPFAGGARTPRRAVALLRPPARFPARPRGAFDRDRRRRRARFRIRRPGPRGRFDRLLPDPLDGRQGLRRARPGGGRDSRRGRTRGGCPSDHLPRRSGRERDRASRNTCAVARRRARSSDSRAFPSSSFAPRSCSAPAASRSRWSGRWSNACRS